MKILHCGSQTPDKITNVISLSNYVNYAIRSLGHELCVFHDRGFILPGRLLQMFPFLQRLELKRLNHKLYLYTKEQRPDICFITRGKYTWPITVAKIKELGIKTILWTIDPPSDFDNVIALARECGIVVCGGSEAIEILKSNKVTNARLLPFACDPQFHRKMELTADEKRRYQHDIVFVGAWYPTREMLFERLNNYDLGIWGPQWDRVKNDSPLRHCIRDGALEAHEWTKVYSAAKIILVSHFQADNVPCYQASPKIYEALACKGFVLCDDQPDVVRLFKDRQHLAIFQDHDDLIHKIDHYLAHDEERQRIALQGYNEVISKHTYVRRVQTILDLIRESSNEN